MDWRERQIMEWLEEVSDEEQVGGSWAEPEFDEITQSDHDSASEIEQPTAQSSEPSDNEEDISAGQHDNYFFIRHNGRNGPNQKWSKSCKNTRSQSNFTITRCKTSAKYTLFQNFSLSCFLIC